MSDSPESNSGSQRSLHHARGHVIDPGVVCPQEPSRFLGMFIPQKLVFPTRPCVDSRSDKSRIAREYGLVERPMPIARPAPLSRENAALRAAHDHVRQDMGGELARLQQQRRGEPGSAQSGAAAHARCVGARLLCRLPQRTRALRRELPGSPAAAGVRRHQPDSGAAGQRRAGDARRSDAETDARYRERATAFARSKKR